MIRAVFRAAAVLLLFAIGAACDRSPDAPTALPDSPAPFTAQAVSPTAVALTWGTEPPGAESFRVERASPTTGFMAVATLRSLEGTYVDEGLLPGTEYTYRVQACNDAGCSPFSEIVQVTTFGVLAIITDSLPPARVGEPYTAAVSALGGDDDYEWMVEAGSLPAGLALSTEREPRSGRRGAIISGMPESVQTANFTLRVESRDGQSAVKAFTIAVLPPPPPLYIETSALPPGLVGGPYDVQLIAAGGDTLHQTWSLVGGSLPAGLELSVEGTIVGTPSTPDSTMPVIQVASAGLTAQQTFVLRVVANAAGTYDLTAYPVADVPEAIRPHVDSAVAQWERVIVGDLQPVAIPRRFFSSTSCAGFGHAVNGTSVDDVIVVIDIAPIDGPGRVLGQAGPCGLRNTGLPFAGVLTLDSEDLQPLIGSITLTHIIAHEIGHILGIGTLWQRFNLVQGTGTDDPRFSGQQAVAAYQALGGAGLVPLENQGGQGTVEGHLRETVFDRALMTGFSEQRGVFQPLTRVSIGSLADIGYQVDLSAADPFSLGSSLTGAAARAGDLGWDRIYQGPVRVLDTQGDAPARFP